MSTKVRVPDLGESVSEATVARWLKKEGDHVAAEEPLVELETDKVNVEVPAPASGRLASVLAKEGETVAPGAELAEIDESASAEAPPAQEDAPAAASGEEGEERTPRRDGGKDEADRARATIPAPPATTPATTADEETPARIDRRAALARLAAAPPPAPPTPADTTSPATSPPSDGPAPAPRRKVPPEDAAREERVKMSRLRQTIARRLKEAQNTAAMLTTFNEVDMSEVIALRQRYRELFREKHGVKLGFMSFFVRAVTRALKEIPQLNAEIAGDEIIYKDYYHIGVAVGTERGLVVPVVREADTLSLAEIERAIADFAQRARSGQLKLEEMAGGTFTITNGGVYGSLMSTPILNMPQTGILGMHKIMHRPVVVEDGGIEARPMMYLALSYDHRLVDGREAVTFLVRVKEFLEDPQRLLLEL